MIQALIDLTLFKFSVVVLSIIFYFFVTFFIEKKEPKILVKLMALLPLPLPHPPNLTGSTSLICLKDNSVPNMKLLIQLHPFLLVGTKNEVISRYYRKPNFKQFHIFCPFSKCLPATFQYTIYFYFTF